MNIVVEVLLLLALAQYLVIDGYVFVGIIILWLIAKAIGWIIYAISVAIINSLKKEVKKWQGD